MSRIPLDHKPTPLLRIAEIYSKRRYGAVLEPGLALLHNRKVLLTVIANESRVARWDTLDSTVKAVAALAAAAEIGGRADRHDRFGKPAVKDQRRSLGLTSQGSRDHCDLPGDRSRSTADQAD